MKLQNKAIKLSILVIVISVLISFNAFAVDISDSILLTEFDTNSSGDNYHFTINDKTLSIDINSDNALEMWVKVYANDDSEEELYSEIQELKNGKTSYDISLNKLDKNLEYRITIFSKAEEGQSFWSIYRDEDLLLKYDSGWGIVINKNVYQVNYNMYNGTLAAKTVTNDEIKAIPESVKAQSNQIVQGITNDYDKVLAIHNWVIENIYYNYDYYYGQSKDITYDSEGVLNSRRSVCEGYSNLFRDLVLAQNIKCIKVSGYALGVSTNGKWDSEHANGTYTNHAWNEAYIHSLGRWIIVDCTWDSGNRYSGGEFREEYPMKHQYFDISVEALSFDHKTIKSPKESYKTASEKKLNNIVSNWAKPTVNNALSLGLVPANMPKTYTDAITREKFCELALQTVKAIADIDDTDKLIDKLGIRDEKEFADTKNKSISALYQLGIINGTSETTFSPDNKLNRQEAAVILKNMAKAFDINVENDEALTAKFTDMDKASSWALEAISFVSGLYDDTCNIGVMSGTSATTFSPLGSYTMEQSIVTMERMYHAVSE